MARFYKRGPSPPNAALFIGISLKNAATDSRQHQVLSIRKSGIQSINKQFINELQIINQNLKLDNEEYLRDKINYDQIINKNNNSLKNKILRKLKNKVLKLLFNK